MWICSLLFGNSELALRLPNVLAFILYLTALHLLFRHEKNGWLSLALKCCLLVNPFLLEYFSLARGYGISIACMLMSLYYVLHLYNKAPYHRRDSIAAVLWAAAALYANLSTVNYYVAVLALLGFRHRQLRNTEMFSTKRQKISYLSIALLPLVWAIVKIFLLKREGQLYFGAESLAETFSSFIWSTRYVNPTADNSGFFTCCTFIALLTISALMSASRRDYNSRLSVTTAILLLIFTGLIAEHYLFDARYPLERTALPLLALCLVFLYYFLKQLLSSVHSHIARASISILLSCSIVIPLCYNFSNTANLTHTYTWKYDANTRDVATRLQQWAITQGAGRISTISNDWILEPSLNYYIYTFRLPFRPTNRDGIRTNTDFVYTGSTDLHDPAFNLVDSLSPSGGRLYIRLSALKHLSK